MKPSHILFVTRKWAPAMGGMETYCHRLTEELARSHQIDIIALPGRPDGSPPAFLALLGFPMDILRRWLALDRQPDILHIGDMALWPVGLLARHSTTVVLSAHGTDVSYPRRGGLKGLLYGLYLKLGSRLLRRAQTIANSSATAAALQENGWGNCSIVPLATDMRSQPLTTPPRRAILFAGRLVRRKGLRWFVNNVLDTLPEDITLEVAGTKWDAAENSALAHPRIRYLGRLDRAGLAQAYASALCVVLPNLELSNGEFEGFGLIACEAAAAGGVVLAANCGGLPEAVIDGQTGFLLASGDAMAWVKAILSVSNWTTSQRTSFVEQSTGQASRHYAWQRVARETIAVYGREAV